MKPKIDEALYKKLKERVQSGVPVDDLLQNYHPYDIRNLLEEATAMELGKRDIRDQYAKPEVFSNVKKIIVNPNLEDYGAFTHNVDPSNALPIKGSGKIILRNADDIATKIHETQHAYDAFSDMNKPDFDPLDADEVTVRKALDMGTKQDLKGLESATEMYGKHFRPEDKLPKLKQLLNFERLVKGQPLKAIAPIAIGAAAMGIGEKAFAGDLKAAKEEAGKLGMDIVLPDLVQSESVNTNEDEILKEQNKKNMTPEIRRFEKIRSVMENRK